LTARFHPRIVAVHSPVYANLPNNPLDASEFYATLARHRVLQASLSSTSTGDIEHVQALLLLTFYEWSVSRGNQAWTYLGLATRAAQAMGLAYEDDLDDLPVSSCRPYEDTCIEDRLGSDRQPSTPAHDDRVFLRQEIRRRTMWCCLILESHLSNGKYRPVSLSNGNISIQLPVSEQAFLFGNRVETLLFTNGAPGTVKRDVSAVRNRKEMTVEFQRHNLSEKEYREIEHNSGEQDEDRESETLNSLYVESSALYSKCVTRGCNQ